MTQEEKAKLYDELKVKAQELAEDGYIDKLALVDMFPELKKSRDEMIRQLLISFVKYDMPDNYSDDFSKEDCLAWLEKQCEKETNGNEREIPNSAWSEEDESIIDNLCNFLEDYGNRYYGCLTSQETISWLKSLKERVQTKVELTQLDKNILEAAIAFVEQNDHFNCCRGVDKHTVLSALRSLSTKNTWKPSLAQLNALSIVSKGYIPDDVDGIVSLYNDLKKI